MAQVAEEGQGNVGQGNRRTGAGRVALPGKAEVGYAEVARGMARSTDGFNAFRG